MKDYIECNGHQVVISAEYKMLTSGWITSMFCGGPYHSMTELSNDMSRLISEKPEGFDLIIDFQDYEGDYDESEH